MTLQRNRRIVFGQPSGPGHDFPHGSAPGGIDEAVRNRQFRLRPIRNAAKEQWVRLLSRPPVELYRRLGGKITKLRLHVCGLRATRAADYDEKGVPVDKTRCASGRAGEKESRRDPQA